MLKRRIGLFLCASVADKSNQMEIKTSQSNIKFTCLLLVCKRPVGSIHVSPIIVDVHCATAIKYTNLNAITTANNIDNMYFQSKIITLRKN